MRAYGIVVLMAVILLIAAIPVWAVEPTVAWQEDFSNPAGPSDAKILYEDKGSGKNGDAVVVKEVSNGIIRFGLKNDPTRAQDRLNMLFGDCYWYQGGKWGPYDLKDYPFVEVKWRGCQSLEFWYGTQTASGTRLPNYTWLQPARTEKDAQGRDWNISILRVAPDSSVPTSGTPVRITGVNFAIYSPTDGKDCIAEIAYIKVRGATDEERAADQKIVTTFKNFPQARWRGFDSFFPFGTYSFFHGGDFENWNGDDNLEGAYGMLARHRFNYVVANNEMELGRFFPQHTEEGRRKFTDAWNALIESAKATGMKLGVDISSLTDGQNLADGYEQFLPVTREIAAAFRDDSAIISWYIRDEPSQADLLPAAMAIRAIQEADPMKRPGLVVFNNYFTAQAYSAYASLNFWDCYPVVEGSRNPWAVRDTAKSYRKVMPDKPMWVVLPAFETIPPAPQGSYVRPSDAEMRLMSYLALAEGAKGLIWFIDWMNEAHLVGFTDRVGQPRGGMIDTLQDLSRRIVPIGKLLLATDPVAESKIEVKQNEPVVGEKGRGITVSVLKHRKLPIRYLVVINEDVDRTRSAKVTLPAAIAGKTGGVYDLFSLDGANEMSGGGFNVKPLAGGDGRIYLVGDRREFAREKSAIQCETASEDARALLPDVSIARRWKLPLIDVDKALNTCRAATRSGDGKKALAAASQAKALLEQSMDDSSELNAARRALSDIRIELAEVGPIAEYPSMDPVWWTGRHHRMMVPNPGFLDLSKRYWEVGRSYRDLYAKYIKGETPGLWTVLNKTRLECLKVREDLLALRRSKLAPASEPAKQLTK